MSCGSCGTGKPNGCKSNGGCSTGGCNRMNVHDWLVNLPFADTENACKVIEVSFKQGSRKEFFRNATSHFFEKGDYVTVEGVSGIDVGEVSLTGELVRIQLKKRGVNEMNPDLKKVLRPSQERDLEAFHISKGREAKILARSREIAIELKLQMKLSEIEIQADGKKATFFYTADDRVDFREMIKMFAAEFKLKVEMKQIGIRQEAAKMGGIGSCGRELCCSTWLTDFKSVNTTAARYQNLSINQTKLSGQCGRLKCCLNFELDTYLDALQHFPENVDVLETSKGNAILIKKDIFKNLMWYILQGGSRHYPLSLARVKEIKRLNKEGVRPDDLEPVDIMAGKRQDIEPEYADLVGQITLKPLEKDRRNRDRGRDRGGNRNGNNSRDGENRRGVERNIENRGENRGERPVQPQHPNTQRSVQPNNPNQQRGNIGGGQQQRHQQNNYRQQQPQRENNGGGQQHSPQNNNRLQQPPRENNGGEQRQNNPNNNRPQSARDGNVGGEQRQNNPNNRPQNPPRENNGGEQRRNSNNNNRNNNNRRPPQNNRPPQQSGEPSGDTNE